MIALTERGDVIDPVTLRDELARRGDLEARRSCPARSTPPWPRRSRWCASRCRATTTRSRWPPGGRAGAERDDAARRTNLAESLELLTRATRLLRTRCIAGLRVDRARVRDLLARSHAEATALSPYLGYDMTAEVVKQAQRGPRRSRRRPRARIDGARGARPAPHPRALTGPRATDRALRRRVQVSPAYQAFPGDVPPINRLCRDAAAHTSETAMRQRTLRRASAGRVDRLRSHSRPPTGCSS